MVVTKDIGEGITEEGSPDMKYYAFDWDDNLLIMPTMIVLKTEDGKEIGMNAKDYAKFRSVIGKEPLKYKDKMIVGYSEKPFRYFGVEGDKEFVVESLLAEPGPAWDDFVEAVNGGSIFSIITSRAHTPNIIKESCYNLIVSNKNGINSDGLVKNLEKYRDLMGQESSNKREMIREYLDMCKFYPVSYGEGSLVNPEEGKVKAMKEFIDYIKKVSKKIHKQAFLKNKVSNRFVPQIGFSDDDPKNVEHMMKHFEEEPILKMYSTKGGEKKRVK